MAAAIGLRTDYTSADLRRFSRRCGDADQVRRLLAVALIYLIVVMFFTKLVGILERRLRSSDH